MKQGFEISCGVGQQGESRRHVRAGGLGGARGEKGDHARSVPTGFNAEVKAALVLPASGGVQGCVDDEAHCASKAETEGKHGSAAPFVKAKGEGDQQEKDSRIDWAKISGELVEVAGHQPAQSLAGGQS